jgi:hypothetical protein
MNNISDELEILKNCLKNLSVKFNERKDLERIHRYNLFNRRLSAVLDSFSDVETIAKRLEENISTIENIERKIQKRNSTEDKEIIKDDGQKLRKEGDRINRQNIVDFKALYAFAKIFLDDYTRLIRHIFDWRNIGNSSVTDFYKSLDSYDGEDQQVISFKEDCFNRLKAVDVFITQYRDDYVVHNQRKHKEITWFLNKMQGDIRFIAGRPSITPKQLIYVVSGYVCCAASFINKNIK